MSKNRAGLPSMAALMDKHSTNPKPRIKYPGARLSASQPTQASQKRVPKRATNQRVAHSDEDDNAAFDEDDDEPDDTAFTQKMLHRNGSTTSIQSRSSHASSARHPPTTDDDDDDQQGYSNHRASQKRKRGSFGTFSDNDLEPEYGSKVIVHEDDNQVPIPRSKNKGLSTMDPKEKKQDPFIKLGKIWPRMIDLFQPVEDVLMVGYEVEQSGGSVPDATGVGALDREEVEKNIKTRRRLHASYKILLAIRPEMHNILSKAFAANDDRKGFNEIVHKIHQSASDTQSNDRASLNRNLPLLIKSKADLTARENRGFHGSETGSLLLPYNKRQTKGNIDRYLNGTEQLKPGSYPHFLFDAPPSDDHPKGLNVLFSRLLIQAGVLLLHGPSAVDFHQSSNGRKERSTKATKSSNAGIIGVNSMTAPLLSWIATLLYFTLTNNNTWQKQSETFPLEGFYHYLRESLMNPESRDSTKKLFEKWNKILFVNQDVPVPTLLEGDHTLLFLASSTENSPEKRASSYAGQVEYEDNQSEAGEQEEDEVARGASANDEGDAN